MFNTEIISLPFRFIFFSENDYLNKIKLVTVLWFQMIFFSIFRQKLKFQVLFQSSS